MSGTDLLHKVVFMLVAVSVVIGVQKVVDITHSLNEDNPRWPDGREFELNVISNGTDSTGGWYAYNDLLFTEHTGTHFDAPCHFAMFPGVYYSSSLPVERLVQPLSVINLQAQANYYRDYEATPDDIITFEKEFGKIPEGGIVIFDFGWSKYWKSFEAVYGSKSEDVTTFHFPGVGLSAAELLASRGVYGVGVDTPSVDYGPSLDFPVHRFLQGQNIFLLENVGNMSALPKGGDGVTLVVGAMKVDGGTGGPARLLALFEDASSGNIPECTLLTVTIVCQIIALFV